MMNENQTFALSGVKVLVVEDDADTAKLFSFILEDEGAIVITAASVEEGLRQVREKHPDILIADHYLADGLGIELLTRIRSGTNQACDNIPAISVTGATCLSEMTVGSQMRTAGFSAFLAKPVDPDELVATVIKLIGTNPD